MLKKATFAGGCFWCMVKPFDVYEGVKKVVSGYIGGSTKNPTYKDVTSGETGHYEAVEIEFDDENISYDQLLNIFWKQIDPLDKYGQFVDRGTQYRSAIFYHDNSQKETAEKSKENLEKLLGQNVATEILEAGEFFVAEEYHQDYYKKNSNHYSMYYKNSGRYAYVKAYWDRNNFARNELKDRLTDIQFEVTQNDMTEVPFENEYYDSFERGLYVDIVDGKPLFSSKDKFKSDCGWPAFSKPITDTSVMERSDYSYGIYRTEVRSSSANIHLGHVFNDGPEDMGGMRYCINSASLRFIPYDKLDEEGYGEYKKYC